MENIERSTLKNFAFITVSDYKGGELSDWSFNLTLEESLDSLLSEILCITESEGLGYEEFKELVSDYYDTYAGRNGRSFYIVTDKSQIDLDEEDLKYIYNKYLENE